jgi:hypothetical protein
LLLTLTFFIIYSIHFDTVTLCDDSGFLLYEFKTSLIEEVSRYRKAVIDFDCYSQLRQELLNISQPNFRNFNLEAYLDDNIRTAGIKIEDALIKVRNLESNIKILEPKFSSSITCNTIEYLNMFRA